MLGEEGRPTHGTGRVHNYPPGELSGANVTYVTVANQLQQRATEAH